eukprot:TRINITY_DN15_c0_g1_i1.p1 TRINITY_DN15_c0_g1~~TRINITY_DN15_c0_g1_i1.p1  ORF type:complete len:798 (-),score=74.68 TRINITY_DN15_c0_g1_i1:156-2549(-)
MFLFLLWVCVGMVVSDNNVDLQTLEILAGMVQSAKEEIAAEGRVPAVCRLPDDRPQGTLDEDQYIQEWAYKLPYRKPQSMPVAARPSGPEFDDVDKYYEISARKVTLEGILGGTYINDEGVSVPRQTEVFAYGPAEESDNSKFSFPAATIDVQVHDKVVVKWINELVDKPAQRKDPKRFVEHLFAVDQTLHWADPECHHGQNHGGPHGLYHGPVPLVTHFHGGSTNEQSDGHPDNWVLPAADNLPHGIRTVGPAYSHFRERSQYADYWTQDSVVADYKEDRAAHLWYHDHAIGITRLNVHAGLLGNFFIRDAAAEAQLPSGDFELPMVIMDRTFYDNGTVWFPDGPQPQNKNVRLPLSGEPTCNGLGASDIAPHWRPGLSGRIHLVNGVAFPSASVYPNCYRWRLLQGSTAKSFTLNMTVYNQHDEINKELTDQMFFRVIGGGHGSLNQPHDVKTIFLMPSERLDILVDFSLIPVGMKVELRNDNWLCPNEVKKIMMFNVVQFPPNQGPSRSCSTYSSNDPPPPPSSVVARTRQIYIQVHPSKSVLADPPTTPKDTIQEYCRPAGSPQVPPINWLQNQLNLQTPVQVPDPFDPSDPTANLKPIQPVVATLFTLSPSPFWPQHYADPITEYPQVGDTEIWELINLSAFPHPIHIHEGSFTVLGHINLTAVDIPAVKRGQQPPQETVPWEDGLTDVVAVKPYTMTRLSIEFHKNGLYVYHCHLLTHEDRDMMRPFCITPENGVPDLSCVQADHGWGNPCAAHPVVVQAPTDKCQDKTDKRPNWTVNFMNKGAADTSQSC